MGISSSAVGKAVARLEERLGVRLFHRSTRSITLTPEGTLFLDRCRRILCEIEAAELEMLRATASPRGKLRICLPFFGMILMPTMADFMRTYPEIELDLDFTDRMVDMIDEGFDVMIHTCEVSDSRLITRSVGTFAYRIVGSPNYFAKRGIPQTLADLKNHSCLHRKYPATGKLSPWPFSRTHAETEIDLPATAVSTALEPLVCLAEQGFGIACLPLFAVGRQLNEGTLVSVLDSRIQESGVFRILWPSSRHPSPKVRAFVDFIADRLCEDICRKKF